MYVGKLVFSLFLIFLVICFRRWGLAKGKKKKKKEKKQEKKKKLVDKKKKKPE